MTTTVELSQSVGSTGIESVTEDDDAASINAWTSFLKDYARGIGSRNPDRPPLSSAHLRRLDSVSRSDQSAQFAEAPLYSSTDVTPTLARLIRDFYCDNGYLPPPRAPWEESRERCILEYDLYSKSQSDKIQSVVDLTAAFFPGALTTFSLFQDRIQTHFALGGPKEVIDGFKLYVGLRIPAEDSLCGHAVLQDRSMLFVPDLKADWRYKHNPFGLAGFKSFIGIPVTLELDPLPNVETPSGHVYPTSGRIAIGTLNICFTHANVHELSQQQQLVVDRLASMLETQLRATWEGDRRRRDARAREELSNFIEEAMIGGLNTKGLNEGGSRAPNRPRTGNHNEAHINQLIESLVVKVKRIITESETVDVYDLRAFSSLSTETQYFDSKSYPLQSLASLPFTPVNQRQLPPAVVKSLLSLSGPVFGLESRSGLEPFLPANTSKHLAIPLADGNHPLYLILVSTTNPAYQFTIADINFVQNLGSLLVAKSIQMRVMGEDAAKTSFLSAISHELRTPMHAVTTSHALMREAISNGTGDLDTLLSLSESSSRTLTNILNDVLDFGKGSAGDLPEGRIELVPDLVATVVHTVKVAQSQYISETSDVAIAVEYEDINWAIHVDEARFQRVLINGLTNAMKFCHSGLIVVRLRSLPDTLVVEIVDTGVGFDEEEMPLVFQAFKKLDINSQGAGLGLHITKAMLEKAGGSLALKSTRGEGTTFEARIPAIWAQPPSLDAGVKSAMVRQQIRPAEQAETGSDRFNKEQALPTKSIAVTPEPVKEEDHSDALRVLIVDDNHICLKLLSMSLRKGPARIDLREARDGSQAVDMFREVHPDLVLTDVSMPGIDGIAAAEMMREHESLANLPRSAIYAVTALGETDSRSKSKGLNGSADLDGWLVKGQNLASIARDIARRLSASGSRRKSEGSSSSRMLPSQTI